VPEWTFDGSSTNQAESSNSDVYLIPAVCYPDPFNDPGDILVLCETWNYDKSQPTRTNNRVKCKEVMSRAKGHDPWFGMEQEFTLLDMDKHPLGWPKGGFPGPQGPYYCGVGARETYGRELVDSVYKALLYAGIKVCGSNAEVMPSQWEYQVGICNGGLEMGDQLWVSRYIMHRVAEAFGIDSSLHPKPFADWNGAGCHTNFSTKAMRAEGGMKAIEEACEKLRPKHDEHIKVYDPKGGEYNKHRLTGLHETASYLTYSWGVADRGASVRIPRDCAVQGKGYLEDRRPASNCDPYAVVTKLVQTICLNE